MSDGWLVLVASYGWFDFHFQYIQYQEFSVNEYQLYNIKETSMYIRKLEEDKENSRILFGYNMQM